VEELAIPSKSVIFLSGKIILILLCYQINFEFYFTNDSFKKGHASLSNQLLSHCLIFLQGLDVPTF